MSRSGGRAATTAVEVRVGVAFVEERKGFSEFATLVVLSKAHAAARAAIIFIIVVAAVAMADSSTADIYAEAAEEEASP